MRRGVGFLLLALVLLGIAPVARGQETMVRMYVLPVDSQIINGTEYRGPMYLKWRMNPDGLDVQWSMKDYGSIDLACVAVNAEQVDHDWLAAQADVFQFPEVIDASVPNAQVKLLQPYLEAHGVPGDWTSPALTWRATLRTITGMMLYMQRLTALTENVSPLDWGYTLNTQWQNVSLEHQAVIVQAATELGYDTAFITATTLLRAIIKAFADAWGSAPILFGFVTL